MRIKVDEDLPDACAELLRERQHEVTTVRGQGMGGSKDSELWREVQREDRFLVTSDKGFANILDYPPGTHGGVLLLRPDEDGIGPVLNLLGAVLSRIRLDDLRGATTVATSKGIRTRRHRVERES